VLIAVEPAIFLQPLVAHDERRALVPPEGQPIEECCGERPDERNSPAGRAGDQGIESVNADCHYCVAGKGSKWRATVFSLPFSMGESKIGWFSSKKLDDGGPTAQVRLTLG
jgi:hypothetical protein